VNIRKKNVPCAYCGCSPATEEDHVIARQFFPADRRYRDNLPKVPACRRCNGAKQKAEDGPGLIFQFGHFSEASQTIIHGRARRTLQKNKRLHRVLQKGLKNVLLRKPSGLLVPSLVINLSHEELSQVWNWFRYVAKGLYFYETGTALPNGHTLHLVKPLSLEQFQGLRDLIGGEGAERREFASGEIRYIFSRNANEQFTGWLIAFKSIDMAWFTVGPVSAAVRDSLAQVECPTPDRNGVKGRASPWVLINSGSLQKD
jgi:hypothetical protein